MRTPSHRMGRWPGIILLLVATGLGAQPRHDRVSQPDAAKVPLPPPRPPITAPVQADDRHANDCILELDKLGAKADPAPDISEGACGATSVVHLERVSHRVVLSPPATLICSMAVAIARWSNETIVVAAQQALGEMPNKMLVGTSYACRNENSQPNGKLSEHAFANALDVMGFAFAKHPPVLIDTPPPNSAEAQFEVAVRQKACDYFTTVLGPGSDAEHGNHLHVDRRRRRGDHRICQ
jgi:hypothetical protein